MGGITLLEHPSLHRPVLVTAFAGWTDASESATRAVRYLVKKLPARRFAVADSEDYYDFTQVRPIVAITPQGDRSLRWPAHEFYYWQGGEGYPGLVLMVGPEPNLRWRSFAREVMDLAEQTGVTLVVGLGALLDAVPHTQETRVSGTASTPELRRLLEAMGVFFSGYQGPTGVASAIYEVCQQRGLPWASLWGHAPHYIQGVPNPKVSYALLQRLSGLVGVPFDLEDLRSAVSFFEEEMNRFLERNPELKGYVRHLEERFGEIVIRPGEREDMPSAEALLKELEEFLRRQRKEGGAEEGQGPPTG